MASNAENVSIWWRHHGFVCVEVIIKASPLRMQIWIFLIIACCRDGFSLTKHGMLRSHISWSGENPKLLDNGLPDQWHFLNSLKSPFNRRHFHWNVFNSLTVFEFGLHLTELSYYFDINTTQYNTTQHNTIQYNTIQYNTIQCNKLYLKSLRNRQHLPMASKRPGAEIYTVQ